MEIFPENSFRRPSLLAMAAAASFLHCSVAQKVQTQPPVIANGHTSLASSVDEASESHESFDKFLMAIKFHMDQVTSSTREVIRLLAKINVDVITTEVGMIVDFTLQLAESNSRSGG